MSALSTITITTVDDAGEDTSDLVVFTPSRHRDGVFEFSGQLAAGIV